MKNHLFKVSSLLLFLLFGLYPIQTKAVPAYPDAIHYTQPDGNTVTIFLKGDEKVNWSESIDGYTLMKNSQGAYEYAVLNTNNDLIPSGVQAMDPANRTQSVKTMLNGVTKGLSYSPSQRSIMMSIMSATNTIPQRAFPTKGTIKFLIILMQFPDRSFTKTQADFNNLFNQVGYLSTDKGSVRDYYKKESYGQLDIAFTVVGPFTAANNIGYYSQTNSRPLITEAVTFADTYVNFADFDNDNDGTVDGIHMIFAGYGAENGVSGTIWSHAWNISGLSKDGKNIYRYSCSPELKGASGTTTTGIGVACHELGHVLGAPDYYDTDYSSGGQFQGTGYWDLMASGSWLNSGDIPAPHNAYTKVKLYHWATATELTSPTTVTIPNAETNPSFYIINSTTPNEYWIMENKQGVYWPGHGLLIYHVDKDVDSYGLNGYNNINATYPQRMYPVCANAGTNPTNTSDSYGSISTAGCTFPGLGNKTQFTDATLPGMISWAGANTGKPITNIVENTTNKTVTFSFMGAGTNIPVTGVSLNTTSLSLTPGQTSVLTATVSPSNATNKNVSWASSNTSVATVSSNGVVSAIAAGSATITTTTQDGAKTATCQVSVTPSGNPTYCAIKGNTSNFYISNVAIGSIDNHSGNNNGYGDFTALSTTMEAGSSQTIVLTAAPFTSSEKWVVWIDYNHDGDFTDSGEEVVSADLTASVRSVTFTVPANATLGSTRMRVARINAGTPAPCGTFADGEAEDYTVNIGTTVPVTGVSLNSAALVLTTGETATLMAKISPSNASNQVVSWVSSNTSVATVSSSGMVTAIAAGSASITVTTADGGKTATCVVTVTTSCTAPIGLRVLYLYEDSAIVRWNGTASWYQIHLSTGRDINSTSATKTILGLQPATQYTCKVRSLCGSTWSDYSAEISFTTPGNISYCTPTVNSSGQWIGLVKIGSINNATSKGTGYSDYTSISTNIAAGSRQSINLVTGWATSNSKWKVWIDFNHNGNFTDNGEAVVDSLFTGSDINASFTVPSTASLGTTRMRVMIVNSTNIIITPCSLPGDGEVEDYTVNIVASSNASYAATGIIEKEATGQEPSAVTIYPNPAGNTLSVKLSDESSIVTARVLDLRGAETLSWSNPKDARLDISSLAKGLYILVVKTDKGEFRNKFTKQ
jgi:M6 family metalloprotease-like protein